MCGKRAVTLRRLSLTSCCYLRRLCAHSTAAAQECVATGVDHNARAVAQISLIDASEQPLLNLYVRVRCWLQLRGCSAS